MKNTYKITVTILFTLLISCNKTTSEKKENEKVLIEETFETKALNGSDISFERTLDLLEKEDYQAAGLELKVGVSELIMEAEASGASSDINFKNSIASLDDFSKNLDDGLSIDPYSLRTTMAYAEMDVAHNYLLDDEVFILDETNRINDAYMSRRFYKGLEFLEDGAAALEGNAKQASEAFLKEGKEIDSLYAIWRKRVKDHLEKRKEHLEKYHPEYITPYGIYPLF